MRILLIAPTLPGINSQLETTSLSEMHPTTVLTGQVSKTDVHTACQRQDYDVLHFATHSSPDAVSLSGGERLDAADIVRLSRLAHARLLFFNSCESAKIAAEAVAQGIPYAIATTVPLHDAEAWPVALAFYDHCQSQRTAVVDMPAAFWGSVDGDGKFLLLVGPHQDGALAGELSRLNQRLGRNELLTLCAWLSTLVLLFVRTLWI